MPSRFTSNFKTQVIAIITNNHNLQDNLVTPKAQEKATTNIVLYLVYIFSLGSIERPYGKANRQKNKILILLAIRNIFRTPHIDFCHTGI